MKSAGEQIAVLEDLHNSWVSRVLQHWGFNEEESLTCARHAAQAARYGQHSHNALKLCHLLEHILLPAGMVEPNAREVRKNISTALEVWDARKALGPVIAYRAVDCAIALAGRHGIGAVAVYNGNHFLWGGDYALRGADAGCICANFCQAAKAEVVPHGGTSPRLGTNPITIAFPGGFLIDMATSVISAGGIQQAAIEGQQLPDGAAFDAEGQPTRNPSAACFLAPFGGYKGSGLSAGIEIFFSLVGSSLPVFRSLQSLPDGESNTPGYFFLAIDAQRISGGDFACGRSQTQNAAAVINSIYEPGSGARIPGDSKIKAKQLCDLHGALLFPAAVAAELERLGARLGIPFPRPASKKRILSVIKPAGDES